MSDTSATTVPETSSTSGKHGELIHVPPDLAPADGECAVLSLVSVRDGNDWVLASGSLLAVEREIALGSWPRWAAAQPLTGRPSASEGFDLGPQFVVDPFGSVRLARQIVEPGDWQAVIDDLIAGEYRVPALRCVVRASAWTSKVFLGRDGSTEAHQAVDGICRPVTAVVAKLDAPAPLELHGNWELALPPHVERGRERGEMYRNRHLTQWSSLVGVEWLAPEISPPPARLVIGRPMSEAWIAGIKPDYDTNELKIDVAWDAEAIDPLGCSLLIRNEQGGLPMLTREIRISDLPSRDERLTDEARLRPWRERLLTVALPRGPRRTDWGAMLLSPDGRVLDERPVVGRVERIELSLYVNASAETASVSITGDRQDPPNAAQRDEAVVQALELEAAARKAAAQRRISTAGELMRYLRWRFSCRAGELLILDVSLLRGAAARDLVLPFLQGLDRPIRALTKSVDASVESDVRQGSAIEARLLPHGTRTLHDRVWLVGDTGLLVGGSVNTFVPSPDRGTSPATTVAELPYADVIEWHQRFESWWGGPARTSR